MQLPLSWLKEFLPIDITPEQIAEKLTLAGLEVDKIERQAPSFEGIVVGEVRRVTPHPNAEKLRIAAVWDGKEEVQVVCAAPNCRTGLKTAFAPIGASLKDKDGKPWKIKKAKLRDVESYGMLCSGQELGLGGNDGIMEFGDDLPTGVDLASLYSETIFEISLTPNLGHCLYALGVARELGAMLNCKPVLPSFEVQEESDPKIETLVKVEIQDEMQCPRYACRLIKDITVGPSPAWLKKRLEDSGLRSINNVVDVTNYIMLELGQPLHAFDFDKISGGKIVVSSQTPYRKLRTLDEVERDIPVGALLICDAEKPLAIAGVMGGSDSAVNESTRTILLEAACFAPQTVRKTSKQLDLRTDSSQRFEKGIDGGAVAATLDRAAELIRKTTGGKVVKDAIDKQALPFEPRILSCRVSRVNQILGTELSMNEVIECLQRLDLHVLNSEQETLQVAIPTYRNDLQIEVDLIEDVARVYGYNNLPKIIPVHITSPLSDAPMYTFEKEVRTKLIAEGLQEFLTCDLISPTLANLTVENGFGAEALIPVLQPSSVDQSILRASLLPGLLQVIKYNIDHQNHDLSGFEVGLIHFKNDGKVVEQPMAAIILSGKARPYHWDPKPQESDFFDLKGIVANLLQAIGIDDFTFEASHLLNFHPGRQARIKVGDTFIGVMGEVHPAHIQTLDIGQRVLFAELSLLDLHRLKKKDYAFIPYPLFPGSERDWTLTLGDETPIEAIIGAISDVRSPLLEKIMLLDLYKSERIGKDRKNVTFRFIYRDPHKTLALEAVENEHAKITQAVAEKLGVSLH